MENNSSDSILVSDDFDENSYSVYVSQALQEMEKLRIVEVRDSINQRALIISSFENKFQTEMNENLKLTENEINVKNKLKQKLMESRINDDELIISKKCLNLINQHEEILENVKQCKFRTQLAYAANSDLLEVEELHLNLNTICNKVDNGNVENSDLEASIMIPQCIAQLGNKLKEQIHHINKEEESKIEESKIEEINIEESNEKPDEVQNEFVENSACEIVTEKKAEEEKNKNILDTCVCEESYSYYKKLADDLDDVTKKLDTFVKNESLKKFILKLKIAINTPINAVSSLNAVHMLDKYNKIVDILRGGFLFATNNISNDTKELYFLFCIDYLCKKFLSQGENLVSKKPEDAFSLASIIIALWIEFPDLGPILLAYFMKKCPYIIPAYWPQFQGQSDKDYYSSLGYNHNNDGSIEDQNMFLKRMSGIFMLYIAIIISTPRNNKPHPHGLRYAWRWIAAIINLEPSPDITATLIHEFLKMAGFKLSQYYGKQFWKIIFLLSTEYYQKLENVTLADFRGPIRRLKEYLEAGLKHGKFIEPEGILSANFW